MRRLLIRWLDLRAGEGRVVAQAFVVLFLIIAGHTTLETARDALFLSKLPPSQLNVVYVVLAALTFFIGSASTRLAAAFGRRNALICSLVVAAYLTTLLRILAPTRAAILSLYVFSGLVGAVLSPQFWLLAGRLFTVAQGRRLFGPIASGGVLGGVAGATAAALLVQTLPVVTLLPVAAGFFVATAMVLTTVSEEEPQSLPSPGFARASTIPPPPPKPATPASWAALLRDNPFLVRIGLLVGLTTAALLVVDYLFKSTAARVLPAASLGMFFARYYAAVNVLSLFVQLFVASRLIRRIGVLPAVAVMPALLMGGGVVALVGGGALLVVLGLKSIDGGMRHSLNRVASELLYLPLPGEARERGKTLIDGVLSRVVQAAVAGVLLVLSVQGLATPRVLAAIVVALAAGWLALTVSMRGTYLDLFRRALARDPRSAAGELGLDAAGTLVESLASPEPANVTAAMEILAQNGREKLIPALVLYHDAKSVLVYALQLFGASAREDWIPLAERLLGHTEEAVRIAAVRALAMHGRVSALEKAREDQSARVQAYAAFHLALREGDAELCDDPSISAILRMPGEVGRESRLGLLRAISDTGDRRAAGVIDELARLEQGADEGVIEQISEAVAKLQDPRFVAPAVQRLGMRVGRESVREALVALGEPALEELRRVLVDASAPRRLRAQIPQTIARFGSQRAADLLAVGLAAEADGLVRYKMLRGLGQLVAKGSVSVDRPRIEREVRRNLEDHMRLLAIETALRAAGGVGALAATPAGRLLGGLLSDKLSQALARAFRLLKIAYRDEDIHRVHAAALSEDKRARANAGEFLDALLVRPDQRALRALLRLALEDAPAAQRVAEAAPLVGAAPRDADAALVALVEDHDEAVAALAAHHAATLGRPDLTRKIDLAKRGRPRVAEQSARLFGDAGDPLEVQRV